MIFYSWICIGRKKKYIEVSMHFRRVRKDIEPLDRTWSKAHKKPMSPNLNFESRHPWQSEHSWELLGFTRTLLGFTRTMLGFTRTTRGFTRTTDLRVRSWTHAWDSWGIACRNRCRWLHAGIAAEERQLQPAVRLVGRLNVFRVS